MKSIPPVIVFEKTDDSPYYEGETVAGTVFFDNQKLRNARSVTINWRGVSKTKVEFFGSTFKKTVFQGTELAWVSKDGTNKMPIGTHLFHFSFRLPKGCPPTLKNVFASNVYKVEVVIDKPWKSSEKVKEEFCVFNYLPKANTQSWLYKKVVNSGVIFNEGPITLSIISPGYTFQAGQTIDFKIKIKNDSSSAMDEISANLFKCCHCHSREQHTACKSSARGSCPLPSEQRAYVGQSTKELVKLDINVEPHSESEFTMPITIPEKRMNPSFSNGLMTLDYFIGFNFFVKGSFLAKRLNVPIQIGEVKKTEELVKGKDVRGDIAPPPYSP